MSRIGKKRIKLPNGATVKIEGSVVVVKGPKGELKLETFGRVKLVEEAGQIEVWLENESLEPSYWGLYRTLISNMLHGVTVGFTKSLEILGTGYVLLSVGKSLTFNLGYSHEIKQDPPEGISFLVESPTKLTISGCDKVKVGQVAANIRELRKVERYKGKGIRYSGEVVPLKAGKSSSGKGGKK